MGREIRRVPTTWEHPRYEPGERHGWDGEYKPLYDEAFDDAIATWMKEATDWVARVRAGETVEHWYADDETEAMWARANPFRAYALWWDAPPDPNTYRDRFAGEPTAYQVYETVTEGTPISPVFTAEDDLIAWMMQDHQYGPDTPHPEWLKWEALSERAAREFLKAGSAPSLVSTPQYGVESGVKAFEHLGKGGQ